MGSIVFLGTPYDDSICDAILIILHIFFSVMNIIICCTISFELANLMLTVRLVAYHELAEAFCGRISQFHEFLWLFQFFDVFIFWRFFVASSMAYNNFVITDEWIMKSRLPAFFLISAYASSHELIKEVLVYWSLRNSCGDLIDLDFVRIIMAAIVEIRTLGLLLGKMIQIDCVLYEFKFL